MKKMEFTDEIRKRISDDVDVWLEKLKRNREKVMTSEYQDWLINYINNHEFIDDDADCRYTLSEEDDKNMSLVCSFVEYIKELATQQHVSYIELYNECYGYFLLRGFFYSFETVHGQGSFNYIKKILNEPINIEQIVIVP